MICFALAKGDADKAKHIFWETPLKEVWMMLWCYYKYNDVKLSVIGDDKEDIEAILKDE